MEDRHDDVQGNQKPRISLDTDGTRQLTVEQVRRSVNAHLQNHNLPPANRDAALEKELSDQRYYQTRNAQARKSHAKTRAKEYLKLGIDDVKIESCLIEPETPQTP